MNLSVLWIFHALGYRGKLATPSGGNEGSRTACRKLRELQGTKTHIFFHEHLTVSSLFYRNTNYQNLEI